MAVIDIIGSDNTQVMGSTSLQIRNKVSSMEGNITGGIFGILANIASAVETELTTTGATSIATFTPTATGMFLVGVYFRVLVAATTTTIAITYHDVTGAQTLTPVNAVSEAVGSYTYLNFICATNSVITVTATAGTANQVYVSSSIIGF